LETFTSLARAAVLSLVWSAVPAISSSLRSNMAFQLRSAASSISDGFGGSPVETTVGGVSIAEMVVTGGRALATSSLGLSGANCANASNVSVLGSSSIAASQYRTTIRFNGFAARNQYTCGSKGD